MAHSVQVRDVFAPSVTRPATLRGCALDTWVALNRPAGKQIAPAGP